MDFNISDELKSAQQLAQQILNDYTTVDKLKLIEKQEERFDAGLWQALADAGLLGLDIPESHGGTELGFYALTMLCEEVGRTVAPIPVIPVLVSAAASSTVGLTVPPRRRWTTPCIRPMCWPRSTTAWALTRTPFSTTT